MSDLSVLRLESRVGASSELRLVGGHVSKLSVLHVGGAPCVRSKHKRGSGLWRGRLCQFRSVVTGFRKSPFLAQWGMCLCHPGMPLVVPFPLRWAWLHGVSCKSPKRVVLSRRRASPGGRSVPEFGRDRRSMMARGRSLPPRTMPLFPMGLGRVSAFNRRLGDLLFAGDR